MYEELLPAPNSASNSNLPSSGTAVEEDDAGGSDDCDIESSPNLRDLLENSDSAKQDSPGSGSADPASRRSVGTSSSMQRWKARPRPTRSDSPRSHQPSVVHPVRAPRACRSSASCLRWRSYGPGLGGTTERAARQLLACDGAAMDWGAPLFRPASAGQSNFAAYSCSASHCTSASAR